MKPDTSDRVEAASERVDTASDLAAPRSYLGAPRAEATLEVTETDEALEPRVVLEWVGDEHDEIAARSRVSFVGATPLEVPAGGRWSFISGGVLTSPTPLLTLLLLAPSPLPRSMPPASTAAALDSGGEGWPGRARGGQRGSVGAAAVMYSCS